MNLEKQKNRSSELTRKQKLARRFLPVALLAGGAAGFAVGEAISADNEPSHEASAKAMVSAQASTEFGGAEDGWGHGTAEDLIRYALGKGTTEAFASIHPVDISTEEIVKIVEDLPVYDQANEALEMAGYTEITPDVGDKLTIKIQVTADSDKDVSYEVVDAEIEDVKNNQ